MATFSTPEPITVDLKLGDGQVQIIASDRQDTVVQVETEGPGPASGRVRVNFTGNKLEIRSTKPAGGRAGNRGPVGVTVEVPSRSSLVTRTANTDIRARGILGACRLNGATGFVELDRTDEVQVNLADGDLRIGCVNGDVVVRSGRSSVHIDEIRGAATVKAATGPVVIGMAGGDLVVATAGGDVAVDHAAANVTVRTAWGNLRVGEVVGGRVDLATGTGDVEVGIRAGLAAWVDALSKNGEVRTLLPPRSGPSSAEDKTEVRARTQNGTILIRPATDPATPADPTGNVDPVAPSNPPSARQPAAKSL
ncbi:DUF4097 family beta strand repeat-containing protein [Candidatus Frankia nodulisporulans]|uniref:DUF4097 family beta strand repeat-containing protein n=1 Tax=Candidatus Frankia nodulisporulans TaxID=2060052 RepID=UPI0013CF9D39|nr:DUF4097 family beta strand repeat-containing protein [Candidatus Frankia nodulisporulans]